MSTLRKLARTGRSDNQQIEPLRKFPAVPEKKMSDVLVDFAEPLLQNLDDDRLFDEAIAFAALCWNLALIPSQEQRAHVNEAVNAMARSGLFERYGIEQSIQMLLNRKRTLFADCSRLIVDYDIVDGPNGPRLLAVSAPPPDGSADG